MDEREHRSDDEPRGSARFRTLPLPVPLEDLQAAHDAEPVHGELDDEYREQSWMINSVG